MNKIEIPVQPDEIDEKRQAFAPYNFVPLPDRIVTQKVNDLPDQGRFDPKRLSGYLDCELTTESPIYIRAGVSNQQAKDGKQSKDIADFFYLNDESEPVIPGSSLRGLIRTLVEVVTYSKVAFVSDKRFVFRAIGDMTTHGDNYRKKLVKFDGEWEEKVGSKTKKSKHFTPLIKAGYIVKTKNGDWTIMPAKNVGGVTYAHLPIEDGFGDFFNTLPSWKDYIATKKVFVKVGKYEYQPVKGGSLHVMYSKVLKAAKSQKDGFEPAIVLKSGDIDKKKSEVVIFEMNEKAKPLTLSDELVDIYIEQLRQSKEQVEILDGNNVEVDKATGVLKHMHPVFYILDNKGEVEFFGYTRMFRVPYPNSIFKYIPESLRNTESLDVVDFAESIFGYTREIGKGKQRAYAGRISVSDAALDSNNSKDLWLSPEKTVIAKILSGPKPTTFQHYLVQGKLDSVFVDGTKKSRHKLADYSEETVVRGVKFYWHKGAVNLDDLQESGTIKKGDKQHTKFNPLKAGIKFSFRINFENLSYEEMGALNFVLKSIASDKQMRIKLGMGKPFGMGAIKLESKLFLRYASKEYSALFDGKVWNHSCQENEEIVQKTVDAFCARMREELGNDLTSTTRIDALYKILQWPGITTDNDGKPTRYMEIQRKEYRDRPVLPTPKTVFGVWNKIKK